MEIDNDPNFKSKIKKEYLRFLSESSEFSTSFSICLAAASIHSFAHPTAVDGTSHKVQGPAVDEIDRLIFSCLIDVVNLSDLEVQEYILELAKKQVLFLEDYGYKNVVRHKCFNPNFLKLADGADAAGRSSTDKS